jgi:hypothetical protein
MKTLREAAAFLILIGAPSGCAAAVIFWILAAGRHAGVCP